MFVDLRSIDYVYVCFPLTITVHTSDLICTADLEEIDEMFCLKCF